MRCCPLGSTKTNGAHGIYHRPTRRAAPFHWLIEISRWLVSLSLVNYAKTKTTKSSIGRKHPSYRHEATGEEADTWLSGPLPPRRSCGDEDVQRQRIWRKTSRATRRPKVQEFDAEPFAAEKISGRI